MRSWLVMARTLHSVVTNENSERDAAGGDWGVEPQESGFVAFWPHPDALGAAEFLAAVSAWSGTQIPSEPLEADADSLWTISLQVPGVESGIIAWCERAREVPRGIGGELATAMASCKWVLRVQTILSSEEPAAEYFMVMGLLGGALPDVIAVLDVVTGELHGRTRLEREFLAEGCEPVESFLWRLSRYEHPKQGELALLGTAGLARCGLPELELVEVPTELADAGAVLVHSLAGLMFENGAPMPGEVVEVGDDLRVTLRHAHEASECVRDGEPGSAAWRTGALEGGLTEFGVPRAAVCGIEPEGSFKQVWRWPRGVVERIAAGRAVLYMTQQNVRAAQRRARASWGSFAMAFASLLRSTDAALRELAARAFVVQAPVPGDKTPRVEQSWFQVRRIAHDSIEVTVVDRPVTRPDLDPGAPLTLKADSVSDWRVELGDALYGPGEAEELLAEVDRLRGVGGESP
jgi:hypothetical protein